MAADRHLRVVDGRCATTSPSRRSTTSVRHGGQLVVRGVAADARRGHVDGICGDYQRDTGGHLRQGRSSTRAAVLADRGARKGRPDDDGRRRIRGTAGRGTAARFLRPVVANAIGTGGAATNPKYQRALLESLPQITLINGYGSSETGNMGFGRQPATGTRPTPSRCARADWCCPRTTSRFLEPGEQRGRLGGPRRADPAGLLQRCRRHPQDLSRG